MKSKPVLITGSAGLIGSEAVLYFCSNGFEVVGVDNNMRADFFGDKGDTRWNVRRLLEQCSNYKHENLDIRSQKEVAELIRTTRPASIVHCAAQPSHDLAKDRPFDDFAVNATGTLNLLEAARHYVHDSPFIFMSTNKVYGDAPNEMPLKETDTRFDYARESDYHGVSELCRIDRTTHSLFGASKTAADILTQEYGRYFGMPTVCFRGGCLTGPNHSGVELHGFLSYLVKVAVSGAEYTVYGYKGKQVRDQIHSTDVVRAMELYMESPRPGEVYNIGGGRENTISILEAFAQIEEVLGRPVRFKYDPENRKGDHVCYISDTRKLKTHYPDWQLTRTLQSMVREMVSAEVDRV